jgi:hypothetical protein
MGPKVQKVSSYLDEPFAEVDFGVAEIHELVR